MTSNSYEVIQLPPDQIVVEGRYREDYGEIEQLAEDIKNRGLIQPITVNQDGKLLAGGRRYQACIEAGLGEIPAIIRESSGHVDELEIELVENSHRKDLTWWEDAQLVAEIYKLTERQDEETGKKSKKKDKGSLRRAGSIAGKSYNQVARDLKLAHSVQAMPDLKKCKSKREAMNVVDRALHSHEVSRNVDEAAARFSEENGDTSAVVRNGSDEGAEHDDEEGETAEDLAAKLFQRANSNYKIGDALAGMEQLAETFKSQGFSPFGLIEIDPPYGIDLHAKKGGQEAAKEDYMKDYNEIPREEYPSFLEKTAKAAYECCNDSGFVVLWFGWEWFYEAYNALVNAGFHVDYTPGVWVKAKEGGEATGQTNKPDMYLARTHEPFFIGRKETAKLHKQGRPNSFIFKGLPHSQKYHPTQRPTELMQEIIKTFCWPGLSVLSPFLGSGATLLACYKLGYPGMGFDLSEENKRQFLNMVLEDLGANSDD